MREYHKLVRDKIPEIILAKGEKPETAVLDDAAYESALRDKLREEVAEYLESGEIEEIADIQEVLRALLDLHGVSFAEMEALREEKREKRGGFAQRIQLLRVYD